MILENHPRAVAQRHAVVIPVGKTLAKDRLTQNREPDMLTCLRWLFEYNSSWASS